MFVPVEQYLPNSFFISDKLVWINQIICVITRAFFAHGDLNVRWKSLQMDPGALSPAQPQQPPGPMISQQAGANGPRLHFTS